MAHTSTSKLDVSGIARALCVGIGGVFRKRIPVGPDAGTVLARHCRDMGEHRAKKLAKLAEVGVLFGTGAEDLTALADVAERHGFDRGEFYDAVTGAHLAATARMRDGAAGDLAFIRGDEPIAILGCGEYATKVRGSDL